MAGAKHFRELVCWQLAQELKLAIYRLADSPKIKRDLRFCDQIREAARSGPRNIAEGFGRRTHREFAMFLDIARGSLMECQNHRQDAVDRGYLSPAEFTSIERSGAEDVRCGSAITALPAQALSDVPSHSRTIAPSNGPSHFRTVERTLALSHRRTVGRTIAPSHRRTGGLPSILSGSLRRISRQDEVVQSQVARPDEFRIAEQLRVVHVCSLVRDGLGRPENSGRPRRVVETR
jgi:four helix bundle protein